MEGEHLDRLAEDIATNGLHDPTAFVLSANVHGCGEDREMPSAGHAAS